MDNREYKWDAEKARIKKDNETIVKQNLFALSWK